MGVFPLSRGLAGYVDSIAYLEPELLAYPIRRPSAKATSVAIIIFTIDRPKPRFQYSLQNSKENQPNQSTLYVWHSLRFTSSDSRPEPVWHIPFPLLFRVLPLYADGKEQCWPDLNIVTLCKPLEPVWYRKRSSLLTGARLHVLTLNPPISMYLTSRASLALFLVILLHMDSCTVLVFFVRMTD